MTTPAPGKKVFVDASSAILLYKAGLFTDLIKVFQVVMAPAVFREITKKGYPGAAYFDSCFNPCFNPLEKTDSSRSARILLQNPLTLDHPLFAFKNFISMDKGEKETIQIFCGLTCFGLPGVHFPDSITADPIPADSSPTEPGLSPLENTKAFIIVDDGRAARFCQAQQIPFINSLLIPKIFWYSGLMNQKVYLEKTDRLCELGRYSKKIMEKARQFSQTDLSYFMERN